LLPQANQSLETVRQGFLMAQGEKKKGKISSPQKVNDTFISKLPGMIASGPVADNGENME